jgi:hypothetical protein
VRKLKNLFVTTAGFGVIAMAGLTLTAEKAEAAYCAPVMIPAGCYYQIIGQCRGINCGPKMGLVRALPGRICPQTYCETFN